MQLEQILSGSLPEQEVVREDNAHSHGKADRAELKTGKRVKLQPTGQAGSTIAQVLAGNVDRGN